MRDFLTWLAILGVPVLALLFVALRLRLRVRYPHDLLAIPKRQGPADLLPRSLRLYYDLILDGLCALAVAAAVAGFPPAADRGEAAVIDCSRSMLSGVRGDRPLDLACAEFLAGGFEGAELFLLDADPENLKPRLNKASRSELAAAKDGPVALAIALEDRRIFLAQDHGLVSALGAAGYSGITLFTDAASGQPSGVAIREYGPRERPLLYPASARREGEASISRWLSRGGAFPQKLEVAGSDGSFLPLDPSLWDYEPSPGGFELWVRAEGVFLLSWHGGAMPFTSFPRPPALRAEGALAESVVSVIEPWLADAWARPDRARVFWLSEERPREPGLRVSGSPMEELVADPETSLGRPVALAYVPGAGPGLGLGPAALASGDSALAVLSAIYGGYRGAMAPSLSAAAYRPLVAGDSGRARAAGEGYVADASYGPQAIVPPASENWSIAPAPPRPMPKPSAPRWPAALALALALFAAAKVVLARAFRPQTERGAGPRQSRA